LQVNNISFYENLQIPKVYSKAVNQRTNNTMAKEKGKNTNNGPQYTTQNYLLLQTKDEPKSTNYT